MPAPSLSSALETCDVVLAEFVSRPAGEKPDYFRGVTCKYRVLDVIRKRLSNSEIRTGKIVKVLYEFHDRSACLAPEGWRFSSEMMPAKKSRWILLIEKERNDRYYTYRGGFGRLPATTENIRRVSGRESK